jgi:iron complex outermembrane recepter protein
MRSHILACLLSATAIGAVPAYANEVDPAPQPSKGAADSGIAEIVVTAQRKEESSQKAAIAISVVSASQLAGVTKPQDISKAAPALQITAAGGNYPLLYVRGVGTFASNPYTDSAVAVNYDGIYLGRPSATYGLMYDLERVEILKGPQGTLYGRNATGGALNILPARPKIGERSVSGAFSYGNYNAVNSQVAINLPVGDIAALRVAATTYSHDGYNTDGTSDEKGAGGRIQLLVKPSENVSLRLAGDYFHVGGSGGTAVLLAQDNAFGVAQPTGFDPSVGPFDPRSIAVLNSNFVPSAGRGRGELSPRPFANNHYYGLLGELNADLGFAKFTVLTSWRRVKQLNSTVPTAFTIASDETDNQFSTEVRLAGAAGPVDWLVGGYYFRETVDAIYGINQNVIGVVQNLESMNKSTAGFGRLTLNATDRLRFTGAMRYTHDVKTFEGRSDVGIELCNDPSRLCPNARTLPGMLFDLPTALAGIGFIRPPGAPVYIDTLGTSKSIWIQVPTIINDRLSSDKATFRGAIEFEPRNGSLLYASVETGYRSGGFAFSSFKPTYSPETITAYTIGSKNRFFGNKLQFNVEAFLWKYKNQQLSHFTPAPSGNVEFVTDNVGDSTNKGVEADIVFKPMRNTLLHANIQYLDARNDKFVFADPDSSAQAGLPAGTIPPLTQCPAVSNRANNSYTINCSGLRALRSPEWTMNLGVQQTVPINAGVELALEVNTHYQSSNIVMFERREFSVQSAYWMTDLGATLRAPDGKWALGVYANNLEDTRVLGATGVFSGLTTAIYGQPRTYGARLQFKF